MKILKKESRKQKRKEKGQVEKKKKECKTVTHPNGCPLRPATREVISRFLVHTWLTPSGLHVTSRYNYCSLLGVRAPFALKPVKERSLFFFATAKNEFQNGFLTCQDSSHWSIILLKLYKSISPMIFLVPHGRADHRVLGINGTRCVDFLTQGVSQ